MLQHDPTNCINLFHCQQFLIQYLEHMKQLVSDPSGTKTLQTYSSQKRLLNKDISQTQLEIQQLFGRIQGSQQFPIYYTHIYRQLCCPLFYSIHQAIVNKCKTQHKTSLDVGDRAIKTLAKCFSKPARITDISVLQCKQAYMSCFGML